MPDACLACGDAATKLCDYVLGFQIARTLPHPVISNDLVMWRCDAPLCNRHAAHVGNVFMCGKFPGAGADTVDYCPAHGEPRRRGKEGDPMFAEDADYLRRLAWAEVRRMFLKVTPPRGVPKTVLSPLSGSDG